MATFKKKSVFNNFNTAYMKIMSLKSMHKFEYHDVI